MTETTTTTIPATEMIYYTYEGNFQLACDAKVLSCQVIPPKEKEEGAPAVPSTTTTTVQLCLDKTVLHAQGGGQPTDLGSITLNNETKQQQVVNITKVLLDRTTGVATHTGTMATTTTTTSSSSGDNSTTTMMMMMDDIVGNAVQVTVNSPNRQILSECHTAGHVVDSAMAKCDSLMPPTKGYHFLDGPYVEYKGSVPVDDRPALLEKLQTAFQELVEDDIDTQIQVLSNKAAAEEVCQNRGVPENYFNLNDFGDETVRIVTVAGWPCPCGGTHVKSTGALKEREWGITGLRCKKGVFRVKYGQQWNSTTK